MNVVTTRTEAIIMESQTRLNKDRLELLEKFRQIVPDFMAAEYVVLAKAYLLR